MKALNLAMPYVIFVIGKPGVGKTQFAAKFSEMFGLPYIESDRLRRAITTQPSFSTAEQEVVDQLMTLQMSELFKTKTTFLLEGSTEAKTVRQNLAKFAKSQGYEPLFVWVQTDQATAHARATKPSRLNTHKQTPMTQARYDQLSRRFTAPAENEKPVVISGKHTYGSQIKSVLKRLALKNRPNTPTLTVPPREIIKPGSITVS